MSLRKFHSGFKFSSALPGHDLRQALGVLESRLEYGTMDQHATPDLIHHLVYHRRNNLNHPSTYRVDQSGEMSVEGVVAVNAVEVKVAEDVAVAVYVADAVVAVVADVDDVHLRHSGFPDSSM